MSQKLTTQKVNAKDSDESDEFSDSVKDLVNIHIKKKLKVMMTTENSLIDTQIQKLAINKLQSVTVFTNQNYVIMFKMIRYINEVLDAMLMKQMKISKNLTSAIVVLESARE